MFSRIKRLYSLLTNEQRKKLLRLQILVVLMAFAELAGVAAIGPFMAVVGDISQLEGEGTLAQLYEMSGAENPRQFLFWLGLAVLMALTVAAAFSMYTIWRLSLYGSKIGADLSTRLYTHYMSQTWLFHASGTSTQLTNRIAQECNRVTSSVIQPLLKMNAKLTMAFIMSSAIFIFNPLVAISGLIIFGVAYFILFKTVRRQLSRNGKTITRTNQLRFKLMNEGFGGIKDTLLLGRQYNFNKRFETASSRWGRAKGITKGLSEAPRYLMELVAFGSAVVLVLYLLSNYEGNLGAVLPVLSVYALAGFKLLPAFQQIYTSVATVRANIASFDSIEKDLAASKYDGVIKKSDCVSKLIPNVSIKLENIDLIYPDKRGKALDGLFITVPVNQVIGLVGSSGSGKSTAVDVLLGLIQPQKGSLKVDGNALNEEKLRAWQNNVGFVPQAIFLSDATIMENIAFGLDPDEISIEKVKKAASMAHLDELLDRLPDGIDTRVGERGIQLSGGQRQRIGIARALYDNADVLVFDEATSALDSITEKLVMDAIHDFSGKKTIILIAHRLTTVKECNRIYLMEAGKVIDEGTFDELAERNQTFRRMAQHS